jgi:hypothetical protein
MVPRTPQPAFARETREGCRAESQRAKAATRPASYVSASKNIETTHAKQPVVFGMAAKTF